MIYYYIEVLTTMFRSLGPLFVQENYLLSVPDAAKFNKKKTMILTSKAADSIAQGDLVERMIRSQNAWSLLPTEAIFASVIPGEYMSGHVAGQIQFPQVMKKVNSYFASIMADFYFYSGLENIRDKINSIEFIKSCKSTLG